jgi:hypothetical protein
MSLKLKVSAGTSLDSLVHISPNTNGLPITSPLFTGVLYVRIANFSGLVPTDAPTFTCTYFVHNHAVTYSIELRGTFHRDMNGDDLVFGNVISDKIRVPPGTSLALGLIKRWIDPGLECDVYADQPWAHSPALVTMNALSTTCSPHYDDAPLKEHLIPGMDAKKRRWHYSKKEHRSAFVFRQGHVIGMDFSNGLADFNDFSVRVPGWGYVSALPLWNGQHLLYILQTRDGNVVFVCKFELVQC